MNIALCASPTLAARPLRCSCKRANRVRAPANRSLAQKHLWRYSPNMWIENFLIRTRLAKSVFLHCPRALRSTVATLYIGNLSSGEEIPFACIAPRKNGGSYALREDNVRRVTFIRWRFVVARGFSMNLRQILQTLNYEQLRCRLKFFLTSGDSRDA